MSEKTALSQLAENDAHISALLHRYANEFDALREAMRKAGEMRDSGDAKAQEFAANLVTAAKDEISRRMELTSGEIVARIAELEKRGVEFDKIAAGGVLEVRRLIEDARKIAAEAKAEKQRMVSLEEISVRLFALAKAASDKAMAAMLKDSDFRDSLKLIFHEYAVPMAAALEAKQAGAFLEIYRGVFRPGVSSAKRGELWTFYGNTFVCTTDTTQPPRSNTSNDSFENWALVAASGAPGAAATGSGGSSSLNISSNGIVRRTAADTYDSVPLELVVAIGDETTAITTGTAKVTMRAPRAMTLTAVRASVNTVSSSGNPTVDINKNGVSIFSTTLSIDANEKTSVTAATAAVISTSSFSDDDEITFDIDTAGTGAKGLKVCLYYY